MKSIDSTKNIINMGELIMCSLNCKKGESITINEQRAKILHKRYANISIDIPQEVLILRDELK